MYNDRCFGDPNDLDASGGRRTHDITELFIDGFDPGILWDKYGIIQDVVVCASASYLIIWMTSEPSLAVYNRFSSC